MAKTPDQTEKQELVPAKQLRTEDGYVWSIYSKEQTGLQINCLEDPETGIVVTTPTATNETRLASHKAWGGARQSRAPGDPWVIYHEMGQKGVNPDEKLEEMFRTYGHASVGDMARFPIDIAGLPSHACMALFSLSSINSGQEKSTRYQKRFGKSVLHGLRNYLPEDLPAAEASRLEQGYQELGSMALENFGRHQPALTEAYTDFYKPEEGNGQHSGALTSRVLDSVRFFLPLGQGSGIDFETSARDHARIIGELKASPVRLYARLGAQIERLLTPSRDEEERLGYLAEAPSLIRHTEAATTVNDNLTRLKAFAQGETDLLKKVAVQTAFKGEVEPIVRLLPEGANTMAERMVAQYFLSLWPGLNEDQLYEWVGGRSVEEKQKISEIIFAGHNNHKELPQNARTTSLTVQFKAFLGEQRDFNRHRAWGRFMNLPQVYGLPWDYSTVQQILAQGYGLPAYLTDVKAFKKQRAAFAADMAAYYDKLYGFIEGVHDTYGDDFNYAFVLNLIPMAHQVDLYMHGDAKQALYMTFQRIRPGGHINYRLLAYDANEQIAASDPYLAALHVPGERPDPASPAEFFDRS